MSHILLDENVPVRLARSITGHHVRHVRYEVWRGLTNGALLSAAEAAGYDVFVTADKNLSYQQNLALRRITVIVPSTNRWPQIRNDLDAVRRAVNAAEPGRLIAVSITPSSRRR